MPNVPNTISLLRLCLVPLVIYLLAQAAYAAALAVFVLASVSDGVDGWVARRYNLRTRFGALLDPLADKLIILSCLLMLTWQGWFPLWLTLSLLARDLLIVAGAYAYHRVVGAIDITPTWLGKTHIFLEFALLCLVLAHAARLVQLMHWLPWLFVLAGVTALLSAAQYVWIWGSRTARHLHGRTH